MDGRIAERKKGRLIFQTLPPETVRTAEKHIHDILRIVVEHTPERRVLVVYDRGCPLSACLTDAYRLCLPGAPFIDFDAVETQSIFSLFEQLSPSDLVVLIQSTSFRLEAFRIRVELFNRSLKVIEHPHLSRISAGEELFYVESLAYDPAYYRGVGEMLKDRLERAKRGVVDSGGEELVFDSGFEPVKMNVGDYRNTKNVGGQFPIGEVFTEARDLEAVNGSVRIFAFGDADFLLNTPEKPITLEVRRGRVVSAAGSTPEFDKVLSAIREEEGEVWLRELGFGMNRAFTHERTVGDIGTYERMCGVHLSLGAKHGLYKKPQIKRKEAKFHVDVFAVTERVLLDGEVVYCDGGWIRP